MSEMIACKGCGGEMGAGVPEPEHCHECPPWVCDGCGEACSMASPCACVIGIEGMALADIKALLARGGLSLSHHGIVS